VLLIPISDAKHHDETESVQTRSLGKVENLKSVIREISNSFEEDSGDMIVLDSHEIVDKKVSSQTLQRG